MEHQGMKTRDWAPFLSPRTNNNPPPIQTLRSVIWSQIHFIQQFQPGSFSKAERFKSASSRNHPRLSESSCLLNQASFEASCFQHHRQEKRERIWPLYQFFVVFSSGYRLFRPTPSTHTRARTHTPGVNFLLRISIWAESCGYFLCSGGALANNSPSVCSRLAVSVLLRPN